MSSSAMRFQRVRTLAILHYFSASFGGLLARRSSDVTRHQRNCSAFVCSWVESNASGNPSVLMFYVTVVSAGLAIAT